jgi:hypothetical protein
VKITMEVVSPEQLAAEEANRCSAKPGPRSTARCECAKGHQFKDYPAADTHSGRTRGGYWKFWVVTAAEMVRDDA